MTDDTSASSRSAAKTSRVEITRRTISPYDLTVGDNPGTVILRPPLRGPNYEEWSANLRLALKARKKFGFADGSIQQPPENSEDYEDLCANNTLLVSWIKITIDESLCSSISHSDNAFQLWTQIQTRFAVKNGQRVQRLKADLANCRQQGSAIEAYYGKLTKLWTSLADYQQGKTLEEIAKEREEDKLHQFLMGLDDSLYVSIKSSLLSRTPSPSVEEAYNVLTQDKESKSLSRMYEERNDGVSFVVQTMKNSQTGCITCSVCGKHGHPAENCFKKIGYPDWWLERTRNKSIPTQRDSASKFGRGNSTVTTSYRKKSEPATVNHVFTTSDQIYANGGNTSQDNSIGAADRVGLMGLSNEQ